MIETIETRESMSDDVLVTPRAEEELTFEPQFFLKKNVMYWK